MTKFIKDCSVPSPAVAAAAAAAAATVPSGRQMILLALPYITRALFEYSFYRYRTLVTYMRYII